jgi:CheY-like chemotaxis protein
LEFSSVFTARPSTLAPEWGSQSASGSSSAQAAESGSSPSPAGGRRFILRSRSETLTQPAQTRKTASILLVEDSAADAGLIRKALEEHGVEGEITILDDGEKAIEFIRRLDLLPAAECPDLAIIDLNLPRRPGREVLESLRSSERGRQIPVLVLSSSDAERDRADAARLGASRYLRKPTRLEDFLRLGIIFKDALPQSPD